MYLLQTLQTHILLVHWNDALVFSKAVKVEVIG